MRWKEMEWNEGIADDFNSFLFSLSFIVVLKFSTRLNIHSFSCLSLVWFRCDECEEGNEMKKGEAEGEKEVMKN